MAKRSRAKRKHRPGQSTRSVPHAPDATLEASAAAPSPKSEPISRFSAQMQRFCDEYLALGETNATEAARRAQYSAKRASATASELLGRDDVRAYLAKKRAPLIAALAEKHNISLDDVIAGTKVISESDVTNYIEYDEIGTMRTKRLDQLPEAMRRNIASIKVREIFVKGKPIGCVTEFKLWSKDRAYDRLERIFTNNPTKPPLEEMTFSDRAAELARIIEAGVRRAKAHKQPAES